MAATPATQPLQVLGIAGSLRRASYNRQLLESARRLAPPALVITPFDIAEVQLYNADQDTDAARPEAVRRLKQAIAASDAVLFAAPEYNHGVPGVLQNAIDWASRPAFASPLAGKPVGMMGASGGISGTMRGQQALKLVLMSTLALIFPHAGIAITTCHLEPADRACDSDRSVARGIARGSTGDCLVPDEVPIHALAGPRDERLEVADRIPHVQRDVQF